MERLRAEQARLLASLREELRGLKEEWVREQEKHPDSQQRADRLSRECLQLRQEKSRLTEELERERVKREEVQQRVRQEREGRELERRARRDAERRIDRLNREHTKVHQEDGREASSIVLEGSSEELPMALDPPETPLRRARETEKPPQPPGPSEKAAPQSSKVQPGDKRPRLGRWIPHPDDSNAGKEWTPTGQERAQSEDPVEMFRKHYDKYLDSYEGYLELIGMLYRMRHGGDTKPDSLEEREWENRLRRASDGIKRTTVRLDTLEEYNPELATDDRVSRRAGLARRHSELERTAQGHTEP